MEESDGLEILDCLFQEDAALTQLKQNLAELDSQIFRWARTRDLQGSTEKSFRLMKIRRAALEIKIATYGA